MQDATAVTEPGKKLAGAIEVLQANEIFPLALLPHLILFFAEHKRALRLVLPAELCATFQEFSEGWGYQCASADLLITQVGSHWGQIASAQGDSCEASHRVLVVSANRDLSTQVLQMELFGESRDVGEALGYPDCCVTAYPSLARAAEHWPITMIERSRRPGQVSMWCNRLASLWGGTCPTGELFPCSLECENAIEYGRLADRLLREHGFSILADEISKQARRPMYLLDEEVVAGHPRDVTATEIVIHG